MNEYNIIWISCSPITTWSV